MDFHDIYYHVNLVMIGFYSTIFIKIEKIQGLIIFIELISS